MKVEDMTEPELQRLMQGIDVAVADELERADPETPPAFVCVVFNDPRLAHYVTTCDPGGTIRALRELADAIERGEDEPHG